MKFIWPIINIVQIVLILLWTAVCGILGMILMLFTWNGPWVHLVNGLYLWSPIICAITGIRIKVTGLEHIDRSSSCIYVANHASHFDILALARTMPVGLFFIAKKELSRVPVLGQYMHFIGHIFVDRKNKESALVSMRAAAEKIKNGKNVISFPEGTRSKTGQLQVFKRGSFIIAKEGEIDILPIGIKGSNAILPSGSSKIRPGVIEIRVGEIIRAKDVKHLSVEELANFTREKVAALIV